MLDKWKIIRMVIQSPNLENIPQRPCFKKKLFATWKSKMVAIFQDGRKRGYILAYDLTQMFSVTDIASNSNAIYHAENNVIIL